MKEENTSIELAEYIIRRDDDRYVYEWDRTTIYCTDMDSAFKCKDIEAIKHLFAFIKWHTKEYNDKHTYEIIVRQTTISTYIDVENREEK